MCRRVHTNIGTYEQNEHSNKMNKLRRIPLAIEEAILRRVLEGATYREVTAEFDVVLSTVNRVVEDARKKMPDVDDLRGLAVILRKHKLSVFDATRAANLVESLNKFGISMQQLGNYVRLNERFLSEKTLEEDFIIWAMKLMEREQACGKTYQETVEDFEKKQRETAELESRKTDVETKFQVLQTETKKAEKHLAEVGSQVQTVTIVRDGFAEIGVNRLAGLVKFICEFESLGFDVRELQKLASTLRRLRKTGIDPDRLHIFIAEKGPLETQLTVLKLAKEKLKDEHAALTQENENYREENSAHSLLDSLWKTGTFTVYCKSCGMPMRIALQSREYYQSLIYSGQVLWIRCPRCGFIAFDPRDIALQIGWNFLPK